MPTAPHPLDLVAIITEETKYKTGMFGYQLGFTTSGKWHPFVICPPKFYEFREAASEAEKDLIRTQAILQRRAKLKSAKYRFQQAQSGDGPGAA